MIKTLIIITITLIAILSALIFAGVSRWDRRTREMIARIEAAATPSSGARFDSTETADLPPIVQRYFSLALTPGQPIVNAVTIHQEGLFNMSETGDNWKHFTSVQRVVTHPPGFVWDARIAMMPGVNVRVHDAFVADEGILHASLFGLFSVANLRGTREIAEGELMRFLAEAAWYPTALLPSQGVRWAGVDDRSADASMEQNGIAVTMRVSFDPDGLIASMRVDARGRVVGGNVIPTPWEGRWRNFSSRNGMVIPTEGEVAWITPGGPRPYWRGTISSIAFQ